MRISATPKIQTYQRLATVAPEASRADGYAGTQEAPGPEARLRQLARTAVVAEPSRSFPGREGFDSAFLGVELPLPKLAAELAADAAPLKDGSGVELEYTHFSVVMSKSRRLPIFAAVNMDGAKLVSLPRRGSWDTDDRIAREHQLGNEAYKHNDLDRGHMVRRLDPVWGEKASQANADTFVYTNAALQHKDLNQREWLALENHVLDNARTQDLKINVYTGPVLDPSDPVFDNNGRVDPPTQIPQKFWKVVAWKDPEEGLKGTAFVLSQEELIDAEDYRDGRFPPGRFRVYQVPLAELEAMTRLDFGDLDDTAVGGRPIDTLDQIRL